MSLKEKIEKDFIEAYKAKDELKSSVFRMLKSAIKNKEIALGKELSDPETEEIIAKEVKQRIDSAEEYKKGNRTELADKELKEVEILMPYLPKQLTRNEISAIVKDAINKTGAGSPADMGKVMGIVMPQAKGKCDGSIVSEIVKNELNK